MKLKTIVTEVEGDIESVLVHIRAVLEHNPQSEVHINPAPDSTLQVGTVHPDSATPSGGKGK